MIHLCVHSRLNISNSIFIKIKLFKCKYNSFRFSAYCFSLYNHNSILHLNIPTSQYQYHNYRKSGRNYRCFFIFPAISNELSKIRLIQQGAKKKIQAQKICSYNNKKYKQQNHSWFFTKMPQFLFCKWFFRSIKRCNNKYCDNSNQTTIK